MSQGKPSRACQVSTHVQWKSEYKMYVHKWRVQSLCLIDIWANGILSSDINYLYLMDANLCICDLGNAK